MKFDNRTIQILRNFSTINKSIVFKPGNIIKTIAPTKSIFVTAKIGAEIDKSFGIYDLPQFLNGVSLFEEPELILGNTSVVITNGKEKLNYVFSDTSLILTPPDKEMQLPSNEVSFELTSQVLSRVLKALSIISLPEIAIIGDGNKVYVSACNSKNSSDSTYKAEVGETDKEFELYFLAENINLLPGDYTVDVSAKGIARFSSDDLTYWICVEKHSKFPEG